MKPKGARSQQGVLPQLLLLRLPMPDLRGKNLGLLSSVRSALLSFANALRMTTLLSCLTVTASPAPACLRLHPKWWPTRKYAGCPGSFALSAKAQDDSLLIRPKKLPRLSELSDLLLDEAPSRDIHDGPASFNLINQLLTLATNSIALCRGAHLGSLKLYQKKFLKLCFTKVRVRIQPSRPHFFGGPSRRQAGMGAYRRTGHYSCLEA